MEISKSPPRSGSTPRIAKEPSVCGSDESTVGSIKGSSGFTPWFPATFSCATRISVCIWACLLVLSCGTLLISVDPSASDSSRSIHVIALLLGTIGFFYILFLVTIVPSGISHEPGNVLVLRASPCCYPLFRFSITDISCIKCIRFRDVADRRFIGFPTDFNKCVLIEFISGWNLLISLQDPQGFVAHLSSIL
jgi:hypothetical protein